MDGTAILCYKDLSHILFLDDAVLLNFHVNKICLQLKMSSLNGDKCAVKKKKSVMTLSQKIQLIDCLAAGESYASVAKKFDVHVTTARSIKRSEESIRSSVSRGLKLSNKVTRIFRPRSRTMERMEEALNAWIEEQKQGETPVTNRRIREEAIRLFDQFKPATETLVFNASREWLRRFKKQFSLGSDETLGEDEIPINQAIGNELPTIGLFEVVLLKNEPNVEDDVQQTTYATSMSLTSVDSILSSAKQLQDLVFEVDPSLERSSKFKNGLENLLQPYEELRKKLRTN
ncbi:hypothetical protein Trydic_g19700 [Trypoxylus dichotomus]